MKVSKIAEQGALLSCSLRESAVAYAFVQSQSSLVNAMQCCNLQHCIGIDGIIYNLVYNHSE